MANPNVFQFTDAAFQKEVLESDTPVLVDFWATWCPPCVALAPVIDDLAEEYKGKIKFGKVDTEANRETAIKYSISSIPTIIIFNKGNIVHKLVGQRAKREYKAALDPLAAVAAK